MQAGGRYIDTAVMAPVHPKLHKTPLLLSGPDAEEALAVTRALDMAANAVPGGVGAASSNKMIRSVMMKGLEALVLECVLAGRKAGVDEAVLELAGGDLSRLWLEEALGLHAGAGGYAWHPARGGDARSCLDREGAGLWRRDGRAPPRIGSRKSAICAFRRRMPRPRTSRIMGRWRI